jgi:protein required for attachment to host cells
MSTTIPSQALILVADGAKAILLRNTGTGQELSLREEVRVTAQSLAEGGPSGSRPQDQSPKETGEATFVKQLAQSMQERLQQNDYAALVVVADPQTLGQFRAAMHKTVEATIVHSLAKDLTNHSTAEIAAALAK